MKITDKAETFLKTVLVKMGFATSLSLSEAEDTLFFEIETDEPALLIGRGGETLNALQYLLGIAANKGEDTRQPIILDVEGYRERRKKSLEELAQRMAEKVVVEKTPVALNPMNPLERRLVHLALKDHPQVETVSEGEEPHRQVTIFPKKAP